MLENRLDLLGCTAAKSGCTGASLGCTWDSLGCSSDWLVRMKTTRPRWSLRCQTDEGTGAVGERIVRRSSRDLGVGPAHQAPPDPLKTQPLQPSDSCQRH